jgi:microcystin-dependent protein
MDMYLGQLFQVAFDWAPNGSMLCEGQQLQVTHYPALYSLLGTTYGGNGQTTFQLPDLRPKGPDGKPDNRWNHGPRTAIVIDGLYPARP